MKIQVQFLVLLPGLRIWHCCDLWSNSETWLGSYIAVAVAVVWASSYPSDLTPSLGTAICLREALKRKKKFLLFQTTELMVFFFQKH